MPFSGVQTCALDRKSTRLNSSHTIISYAAFCLKKKTRTRDPLVGASPVSALPHRDRRRAAAAAGVSWQVTGLTGRLAPGGRFLVIFFFNNTAPPEISPLSLQTLFR